MFSYLLMIQRSLTSPLCRERRRLACASRNQRLVGHVISSEQNPVALLARTVRLLRYAHYHRGNLRLL
jgi:hypothetical protein